MCETIKEDVFLGIASPGEKKKIVNEHSDDYPTYLILYLLLEIKPISPYGMWGMMTLTGLQRKNCSPAGGQKIPD